VKQIDLAFHLALCRPPSEAESHRLLEFLHSGDQTALEQMCRVILNLNEFVYPE
jgi:hypothetical protein